jgi:hypothetical protein
MSSKKVSKTAPARKSWPLPEQWPLPADAIKIAKAAQRLASTIRENVLTTDHNSPAHGLGFRENEAAVAVELQQMEEILYLDPPFILMQWPSGWSEDVTRKLRAIQALFKGVARYFGRQPQTLDDGEATGDWGGECPPLRYSLGEDVEPWERAQNGLDIIWVDELAQQGRDLETLLMAYDGGEPARESTRDNPPAIKENNSGAAGASPQVVIPVSDAKMSPRNLAEKYGVGAEALRKRLDRWRYAHDAGYVEVSNPPRNEPKYLYDESAVMSVIEVLKAKSAGRKRAADGRRKEL